MPGCWFLPLAEIVAEPIKYKSLIFFHVAFALSLGFQNKTLETTVREMKAQGLNAKVLSEFYWLKLM